MQRYFGMEFQNVHICYIRLPINRFAFLHLLP